MSHSEATKACVSAATPRFLSASSHLARLSSQARRSTAATRPSASWAGSCVFGRRFQRFATTNRLSLAPAPPGRHRSRNESERRDEWRIAMAGPLRHISFRAARKLLTRSQNPLRVRSCVNLVHSFSNLFAFLALGVRFERLRRMIL